MPWLAKPGISVQNGKGAGFRAFFFVLMTMHWQKYILFSGLSLLAGPLLAAAFVDPASKISFTLPAGWKVRSVVQEGVRVIKVVPPKADQRERAAIEVTLQERKAGKADAPERLQRRFRQAEADREAAVYTRLNPHSGRLVTEYREGSFVSGRLWIVRHNLQVFLPTPGKRLLVARCAANASEFKTYRRQLETICLSATFLHKP
ncbi:hypothetical protein DFR38_1074 [Aquitalea magnusonii]|uniref:Uncharacterized protein n=2 Tax=Aquitalea magnusonii TaxID=332411 RepID=A0A318JEG1_9NEIS|nr:hypothetical protein DFR38_1074 [Aquitalea magnusonii]